MAYSIQRQETTGLWLVTFNGQDLGRGAEPNIAISLAIGRVQAINDPITGRGPGSIPPLTTGSQDQLLAQAAAIQRQEDNLRQSESQTTTEAASSQAASGGTSSTPQTQGGASAANPANADTAQGGDPSVTNTTVGPSPTPNNSENQSANETGSAFARGPDQTDAETARLNRQANAASAAAASPGGDVNQSAAETARLNRQANAASPNDIANPNNSTTNAGSDQTGGSNDDAPDSMAETTRSAAAADANSQGLKKNIPLTNPLDKYANYTYNLSLYMLTPEDYNSFVTSNTTSATISLPGDQLLIRSGGGPTGSSNRNPFFSDCDFVLDDLKIDSVIGFSEQGIPSSMGKISFTVTEPLGATFIYRLQSATATLANKDPNSAKQYFAHTYAMVVRFYAYDDFGAPITPKGGVNQLDQANSSESAVVTKIFFFLLTDIKTRIGARIVEYKIEGIHYPNAGARTQNLGTSPAHFEVTGSNLDEVLNGTPGSTNSEIQSANETGSAFARGPDQADAETARLNRQAGAPTAAGQSSQNVPVRGLCQALNNHYKELASPGGQDVQSIEIPDEYEVLFASEKLRSAKTVTPGVDNSLQTSAGSPTSGPASTKAENTRKNTSVSKTAKGFKIYEGESIIQFIDEVISNTDYIKNQSKFLINESADTDVNSDADRDAKKAQGQTPLTWYKISTFSKILGYDNLRKVYAQKIIYVISDYAVTRTKTPYFNRAPWRGPDKVYNFTFTGQNTTILNYEQDFNALYIETFGYGAKLDSDPAQQAAEAFGEVGPSNAFRVVAGTGKKGSLGDSTDPTSRARAGLYSFTDLAKVKLKIVGDPDLLLQDYYNVNQALAANKKSTEPQDGNNSNVINTTAGQIYFTVTFLTGDDYDLKKGIMDLASKSGYVRRQSTAYELTNIVSNFQSGRFTQDLNGIILSYVNPDQPYVDGDYNTSAAGQAAAGATVDSTTESNGQVAREESTPTETLSFDSNGWGDIRVQEGGPSSVPQKPTDAVPAAPLSFAQRQAAAAEVMKQARRDQFRRKLLPNQAQTGNDDAPGISDIIAP